MELATYQCVFILSNSPNSTCPSMIVFGTTNIRSICFKKIQYLFYQVLKASSPNELNRVRSEYPPKCFLAFHWGSIKPLSHCLHLGQCPISIKGHKSNPRAQKWQPVTRALATICPWIRTQLSPFMNPIANATLNFGRIPKHI